MRLWRAKCDGARPVCKKPVGWYMNETFQNRIMCIWKAFNSIPVFASPYTTINFNRVFAGCVCFCVCVCKCNRKRMVTGAYGELRAFQWGKMYPTLIKSELHKFVKCGWRCRASFHSPFSTLRCSFRFIFDLLERATSTGMAWHQIRAVTAWNALRYVAGLHMHNMS